MKRLLFIMCLCFIAQESNAGDLKPPQFVPCFTVIQNIKTDHVCAIVNVEGRKYSMMFSQDGTTIVALIRIHDDGTEEVLYLIRDTVNV